MKYSTRFLKYYKFKPLHMVKIRMTNLPIKKVKLYDLPVMLIDVPLYMLAVDGMRFKLSKDNTIRSGFTIGYGSIKGVPHSVATAVNDTGYLKNLEKMSSNRVVLDSSIKSNHIILAILKLMNDVGYNYEDRVEFEIPEFTELAELIKTYDTGSGILPYENVSVYNFKTGKIKDVSGGVTKSQLNEFLAEYIIKFLIQVQKDMANGLYPDKVFPGESVCVEERKNEILNALEAISFEKMKEMHDKVRLFLYRTSAVYNVVFFSVERYHVIFKVQWF